MAVQQRVRFLSAERLDLVDLLNVSAFANADWSAWIDNAITGLSEPLIVSGFTIPDPDTIVTQVVSTVSITIDGSVLMHPSSTGGAGGFYIAAPGTDAQEVSLTAGQTNFIEVDQTTSTGSTDTRAIWDEAGGADGTGEEFSQAIDTVTNLDVIVTVNTVGFTVGKVPIAKVVVDANGTVDSITDSRNLYFRLGTGGTTPDPNFQFGWSEGRTDHGVTLTTADPTDNPFTGSDKVITTEKQWKNAVMSRIAELQGAGAKWFEGGSTGSGSISDLFVDSVGSVMTSIDGAGTFAWDTGTNTLTWNSDIEVHWHSGPYFFTIPADSVSVTTGDAAYLVQLRNLPFPVTSDTLAWALGATFVNGDPGGGSFTGLESDTTSAAGRGDWIKKTTDNLDRYVRIADFYDAPGGALGGGALTTDAAAVSVELVQAYMGTSDNAIGVYAKGAYTITSQAASNINFNTNNWVLAARWGSPTGKLYVRDMGEFEDGEERQIGDNISPALLSFVGAVDESDSDPSYATSITGAVAAPNWQTTNGESLTVRSSKLTSAAAGASQDKNLILVRKTPSTLADNFYWDGTDLLWEELYLEATGDDEDRNSIADQTSPFVGLTDLADGECIYVTFLRNPGGNTSLAVTQATVASLDPATLNDQVVILARRIDNEVYDFTGKKVTGPPAFITIGDGVISQGDFNGDDKTPFTNAIASLPSTGGRIFVKKGTYTFGSKLAISTDGVQIDAEGPNCVHITAAIASDSVIEISSDYVTIQNLHITNTSDTASLGLSLTSAASGCTIERNFIELTGTANTGARGVVCAGNKNRINRNKVEVYVGTTSSGEAYGIAILATGASTATVEGNQVLENEINVTGSDTGTLFSGVELQASGAGTATLTVERNVVANNFGSKGATGGVARLIRGIASSSAAGATSTLTENIIQGNLCIDWSNSGLALVRGVTGTNTVTLNAVLGNLCSAQPDYTNMANTISNSNTLASSTSYTVDAGITASTQVTDHKFQQF